MQKLTDLISGWFFLCIAPSQCRVAIYCKDGWIPGAVLKDRIWLFLKDAQKPTNLRLDKKNKLKDEDKTIGKI